MVDPVATSVTTAMRPEREERIRVFLLIKGLGAGGAEKLLCLAAEARDRTGFDYQAAYLLPWKDALTGDLDRIGVPVTCLAGGKEWDLRWAVRLWRELAARPVDIVHVHSPYVAGIARIVVRLLPRRARPRSVYTEHLPWSGYVAPTRILNRLTYSMDDATILVSHAVRDGLPRRFQERGRVIVHGLPLDRVRRFRDDRAEMRRRLGIDDGELVVGTVANLRHQKRYPDLLRAAREVVAAGVPVRFLAAGQGPCEGEIRTLHAELGLGDRFRLLGYLQEPAQMLAACDVFVLTSAFEGLPVAMMEALALGLPVVATDVPGTNEAVRDGVEAVLVPPGRPDLIAEALVQVLTDDRRRELMAQAAVERSSAFDLDGSVREIEDIYRELAGRPADRRKPPRGVRPRMRRG